jgi:hypothetical protein
MLASQRALSPTTQETKTRRVLQVKMNRNVESTSKKRKVIYYFKDAPKRKQACFKNGVARYFYSRAARE